MKVCGSCNQEKLPSDFYKRKASKDGLAAKCKVCQSEYDKARANNPDRVKARSEYAKTKAGKEAADRARKKWAANNAGKIYESTKSYRQKFPKKYKAHGKIAYAIKMKQIKRQPCEVCGHEKSVAHHDDYDYPLSIRWLCDKHHKEWHAENGEGLNAN